MSSFPAALDPVSGRSDTKHREHPIKVSTTLLTADVYRTFSINTSEVNQPYSSVASSPILGWDIHASNSFTSLSNLPFRPADSTPARSFVLKEFKHVSDGLIWLYFYINHSCNIYKLYDENRQACFLLNQYPTQTELLLIYAIALLCIQL